MYRQLDHKQRIGNNVALTSAPLIFLVSPSGHEHYQRELAELVASAAGPLDAAIAELRARHDIEQLTPQVMPGRP